VLKLDVDVIASRFLPGHTISAADLAAAFAALTALRDAS
jgi:hypothetical protein